MPDVPEGARHGTVGCVTDLAGRSILVAGASGGLGSAISRLLAADGALLTLVGRDLARLDALGLDAVSVPSDLRKPASAGQVVGRAVREHGSLDGVVVASGVVAFGSAVDTPDEVLVDVFTINTLAPIRLLRAAAEHLTASAAAGNESFFASISAVVAEAPMAGMAGYSASKAALSAYDAAAARELRRARVRVLDIRPPHTETGLAQRPVHGDPPRLPTGLDPEAVAARIVSAIKDGERDVPSTAFF